MKYKITALILTIIMLFTGCSAPVSTAALNSDPQPKGYMEMTTSKYILVGYGKFSITPNTPLPIKSIESAENVEAKITDYKFPADQVVKYNSFKNQDMKNYTYIDLYFKPENGKRYNHKYGVPTIEFQGKIKAEVIPEEVNLPPTPKENQDKNFFIGFDTRENVVVVTDYYNGSTNGYRVDQTGSENEDNSKIEQTINQALANCYSTFSSTPKFREAIQEIEKSLKSRNQKDVARAIYDWITANISYDKEKAEKNYFETDAVSEISANKALEDRKTICTGFAYLYNALAKYFGLKSYVIMGVGKKYEHAWNAVQLEDGTELAVDCTFGVHEPDKFFVSAPDKYFTEYHQMWSNKEGKFIPFTDFSSCVLAD